MKANGILRSLCADKECLESLTNVYEAFTLLEEVIESLPPPRLSKKEEPLIDNVANREEIKAALSSQGISDENLVSYAISRQLHGLYPDQPWTGSSCPICGQKPTLILVQEKPELTYVSRETKARCICGHEKDIEPYTCPSCGRQGRGNFEVYVAPGSSVRVYVCKNCGHRFAEIQDTGLGEKELQALHGAIRLLLKEVELSSHETG